MNATYVTKRLLEATLKLFVTFAGNSNIGLIERQKFEAYKKSTKKTCPSKGARMHF